MDKGTEDKVVDVVRNLVFHLKKGYMIVKCRGQQEIQDQLSLSEALQREKIFFQDHPYFRCACLGFIMDQSKPRMSGLPGDNGSHPTDVWSVCVCVRACVPECVRGRSRGGRERRKTYGKSYLSSFLCSLQFLLDLLQGQVFLLWRS